MLNSSIDSKKLLGHTDELNEIFRIYIEDINPFIVRFEVADGEFPAEIQNEIRAMYGHLVRASMADTEALVASNIQKMRSHSKRALLDCFKYTSVLCSDEYKSFMDKYKGIDLSYIDEGEFLPDIVSRYEGAKKDLQKAKMLETSNVSDDELFDMYQLAYKQFEELREILKTHEDKADFLQHKAIKKDRVSQISLAVGIIGAVFGIVGVAVGIFL